MGSFNQTCALSGLPITSGTPLRWLLLIQRPYKDNDTIAPGCYYLPRATPLRVKYDDCGEVYPLDEATQGKEFEKTLIYPYWIQQFQTDLVELEQGENQYHEPAATKDLTLDHLQWLLHEGRLQVSIEEASSHANEQTHIVRSYIREDVWQAALDLVDKFIKEDDYWPKKTCTLKAYKENFLKLVEDFTAEQREDRYFDKEYPLYRYNMINRKKYHPLDFLAGGGYAGGIAFPFYRGIREQSQWMLHKLYKKEWSLDDPQVKELFLDLAETYLIHSFLSYINQPWQQSLYGSQESQWSLQSKFHKKLSLIAAKEIATEEDEE